MPRFSLTALACASALVLAGCASKPEPTAEAGAGAGAGAGVSTPSVDESSVQFFRESVGDRVFFETDSATLTPAARAILDKQARWLTLNPTVAVSIEGHADERGTREYNLALGARRANAARAYLIAQGVAAERLRAVTFGKERPVEVCSQETCWSKNRRSVTAVGGAGS